MGNDNATVDAVKARLAQLAQQKLDYTMGWPDNAVWWYLGSSVQKTSDGGYYLLAKISEKVPLDSDTGWPYGLPHDVGGVQVQSSRANPLWHQPGQPY